MTYWLYKALALLPLPIKYALARVAAFCCTESSAIAPP